MDLNGSPRPQLPFSFFFSTRANNALCLKVAGITCCHLTSVRFFSPSCLLLFRKERKKEATWRPQLGSNQHPRIYFSNVTLAVFFLPLSKKNPDILYDEPTEKMRRPCRMNQHSILHGYYRPRRGLSDVVSTQGLFLSLANPRTTNGPQRLGGPVSCYVFFRSLSRA